MINRNSDAWGGAWGLAWGGAWGWSSRGMAQRRARGGGPEFVPYRRTTDDVLRVVVALITSGALD